MNRVHTTACQQCLKCDNYRGVSQAPSDHGHAPDWRSDSEGETGEDRAAGTAPPVSNPKRRAKPATRHKPAKRARPAAKSRRTAMAGALHKP